MYHMFLFGATKGTGQKLSIYSLRPCVLLCMLLLPLGQFRVRGEFEEVPAYKSLKPFFVQSISKPSSLLLPPPPPPHPHPHPHHHHHQRCFIFFLFVRSSVLQFHLHAHPSFIFILVLVLIIVSVFCLSLSCVREEF